MKNLFVASEFEAEYFTKGLKKVSQSLYEGSYRVIITGVGLVNMSTTVTKAAQKYPEETFINAGIAGATGKYRKGEVLEIQNFYMLDPSETVTAPTSVLMTQAYPHLEKGQGVALYTSICPVWNDHRFIIRNDNLVDMEGYAFAKICSDLGIDFKCFKAVSDNLVKNSQEEFLTNARQALENLRTYLLNNVLN